MSCKHLLNGAPDCVFCHRDQLRGELTLAEEGLANYHQEALALHERIAVLQLERNRLKQGIEKALEWCYRENVYGHVRNELEIADSPEPQPDKPA